MYIEIVILALLVLGFLVLGFLARRRILRAVGRFLVVEEDGRSFDAIVLLNGNLSTRAYRVVDLYKRSRAPVLIARLADTEEVRLGVIPNITDATRTLLLRLGVAAEDIQVLTSDRWVAGTWAEAILASARIRERGYRRIAIVTDALHTRRARWAFREIMRDDSVGFFCVATHYSLQLMGHWWRTQYGLIQVVSEYMKFIHYLGLARAARRGAPPAESDLPDARATRRCVTGYTRRPPAARFQGRNRDL